MKMKITFQIYYKRGFSAEKCRFCTALKLKFPSAENPLTEV